MQMRVSLQNVLWKPLYYLVRMRDQGRSLSEHIAVFASARFGPFIHH